MYSDNLEEIVKLIKEYRKKKEAVSIGYLGNVVDLWYGTDILAVVNSNHF